MANAAHNLQVFQIVPEVTPGTLVPATFKLVGETEVTYPIDREFEDFPRGVYAPYTAGGIDLKNATMINHAGNLSYEELTHVLAMTLKTPAVSGVGPYVYANTRVWTTPPVITTYSAEMIENDGATKHLEKTAAYMVATGFEVDIARNAIAKYKLNAFARAAANAPAGTVNGLAPLTGRAPIASNLFKFYLDDTWAGLGGTQKSTVLRAAALKYANGARPGYTLDGRTSLDHTKVDYDKASGTLSLTCEFDATAAAEIAKYESHSLRFIRLKATDGTKIAQFDICAIHKSEPKFSTDNNVRLATFDFAMEYDPTGAQMLKATTTTNLATLATV